MRNNRYEYWQNVITGKWNFHLVGKNNEVQTYSNQGYNSEADVIRGIKDAKRNSRFASIRRIFR